MRVKRHREPVSPPDLTAASFETLAAEVKRRGLELLPAGMTTYFATRLAQLECDLVDVRLATREAVTRGLQELTRGTRAELEAEALAAAVVARELADIEREGA